MAISSIPAIETLIKQYGYYRAYVCHCDGYETHVYRRDNYELRWRIVKGQFQMNQTHLLLKKWSSIADMEEALKLYHTNVAV